MKIPLSAAFRELCRYELSLPRDDADDEADDAASLGGPASGAVFGASIEPLDEAGARFVTAFTVDDDDDATAGATTWAFETDASGTPLARVELPRFGSTEGGTYRVVPVSDIDGESHVSPFL